MSTDNDRTPPEPLIYHAKSETEVNNLIESLHQRYPDAAMHTVQVSVRLVEAGLEVTLHGSGLHAVLTLDITADPREMYSLIDHLPETVKSALRTAFDQIDEQAAGGS